MVIGMTMPGNMFDCDPDGQSGGFTLTRPSDAAAPPQAADDALRALDTALVAHVRAIATRDEQALAALYDATSRRVYGLALRITGRADAAEEVAADVYMQVWRDAARYDLGRGRVLTWLLTICRSRAIDSIRRRDPAEPCAEPEQLAVDAGGGVGPEALILLAERDEALRKALEGLEPIQRQLVSLAFFRGLTHEEIAAHTELPLGSVKTHIRRALQSLQGVLGSTMQAG